MANFKLDDLRAIAEADTPKHWFLRLFAILGFAGWASK